MKSRKNLFRITKKAFNAWRLSIRRSDAIFYCYFPDKAFGGSPRKSLAAAQKTLAEITALLDGARRVDGKLSARTIRRANKLLKDAVLERDSQSAARKAEVKARIIALACSPPPRGRSRWTLQLLTEKVVERKIVPAICRDTIRLALKNANHVLK